LNKNVRELREESINILMDGKNKDYCAEAMFAFIVPNLNIWSFRS